MMGMFWTRRLAYTPLLRPTKRVKVFVSLLDRRTPLFFFQRHLQAHLQEHQRGASLFWGRKRVVGARGELCALTSPVEGGDRDRRRERLVFFFLPFFFLGICTEFNTFSLLPLGVFSQKHVVEEEAKKPPQEAKSANNYYYNNNNHAGKQRTSWERIMANRDRSSGYIWYARRAEAERERREVFLRRQY